jgi:transcriptional regulator with XRE-family HTH domain
MRSGEILREARLRAGLTQSDLAAGVGTTQSAISRWEVGSASPPLETLRRLLLACGLELRVGIEPYDPGEASLVEWNLGLTPAQRLDQLVRTVAFIRDGRAAMDRRLG